MPDPRHGAPRPSRAIVFRLARAIVMIVPMVLWPMMVVFILAIGLFEMTMRLVLAPLQTPRARQVVTEVDDETWER